MMKDILKFPSMKPFEGIDTSREAIDFGSGSWAQIS